MTRNNQSDILSDNLKLTLGERIADWRNKLKLSQVQLAEMSGTSPMAISHYENNDNNPPLSTLAAIAKALGVTTDYLLGISKNPTPNDIFSQSFVNQDSFEITYGQICGELSTLEDVHKTIILSVLRYVKVIDVNNIQVLLDNYCKLSNEKQKRVNSYIDGVLEK